MMRVRIALETMRDVSEFVAITTKIPHKVMLVCEHFKVSAKSLLGALCSMEWDEVWCECEVDIYHEIEKFVI
jgi:hypothetical protein